ncbi:MULTISPECIES: hypothetical protein [Arthrobacter]|uniref:Uncharacterized protein n=1 Tax=Arthrobacter cupressi TaxID=1045773 RepID=A0A1G8NEP2_9MICC|nr:MULTISPECIES: hypothetical protein [Arthrobacter]NYD78258.1 hypothetical protein [Arthrobacter cupressi]SDI78741.1 hypothetical protein SAMN05216555_104232 [Arthrobacter cupressi]
MKRIALLGNRVAPVSPTGSHVPASGPWSPDAEPQAVQTFAEGHVFPAHNGIPTMWRPRPAMAVSA